LRHPPLGCSRFTLDSPVRNFSRIACNDGSAVIRVARDGGGIAQMMSYQVAADLSEGLLEPALQDYAPHPLPVNAVYPGGRLLPAKVRALLDEWVPNLRAVLSGFDIH